MVLAPDVNYFLNSRKQGLPCRLVFLTSERGCLHSKALDKSTFFEWESTFSECKSLSKSKSPGPDGIVNKVLGMLPHEFQGTIHSLCHHVGLSYYTNLLENQQHHPRIQELGS